VFWRADTDQDSGSTTIDRSAAQVAAGVAGDRLPTTSMWEVISRPFRDPRLLDGDHAGQRGRDRDPDLFFLAARLREGPTKNIEPRGTPSWVVLDLFFFLAG